MVARRALPAPIPLTLYGLALATMLLPLRGVVDASAIANRVLLLLQVMSVAVPVAIDLRHGRLQQALRWVSPGIVRVVALLVIVGGGRDRVPCLLRFHGAGTLGARGHGQRSGIRTGLRHDGRCALRRGARVSFDAVDPVAPERAHADPALLRAVRVTLTVLAVAGVVLVTLGSLGLIPAPALGDSNR